MQNHMHIKYYQYNIYSFILLFTHFHEPILQFRFRTETCSVLAIYQLITIDTSHNPSRKKKTIFLHQLLHTLWLVRALSPPTQPPPVPAYLLEPMVAPQVITRHSVATLLKLIMPLLYQQHGCWISRERLNAEQRMPTITASPCFC